MKTVLAIDIGGTNTKMALVESTGTVGEVVSTPTDGEHGLDYYLQAIAQSAKKIISERGKRIDGVGIGVAGFIDPAHTMMTFNPNIAWLEKAPLKDYFSSQLSLPVVIEIDSNAAALAEAVYGYGRDSQRLLVLAIGTGLGGGMTVNGEVLRIANECLGDVGHVIVEPGGPQCESGCKGCAEAMVSAPALERYFSELTQKDLPISDEKKESGKILSTYEIIQSAQAGDDVSIQAIEKTGRYLGIALASIVPILAPDKVCIAGGVSEAGEILMNTARASFEEISGPPYSENVLIGKASLGWQSILVGAAESFWRKQNYSSFSWDTNRSP